MDAREIAFCRVHDEYRRVFGDVFPTAVVLASFEEWIDMMKKCIAEGKPYEYDESLIY